MSRRYFSFKITVQFGLALTKPRRTTFVQFQTAYEVRPATRTKCIRRGPHGGQSVDSTARVQSTWDAESEQIPSCHTPILQFHFDLFEFLSEPPEKRPWKAALLRPLAFVRDHGPERGRREQHSRQ